MKGFIASAIAWTVLLPGTATSEQAAPMEAGQITIAYVPPKNPAHQIFTSVCRKSASSKSCRKS